MEKQFWHDKWERNEIAFHGGEPHPLLVHNLPALGLATGARLFLPLSGKSLDIGWLRGRGYEVAAIELSRLAIEQLFAELKIEPRVSEVGPLELFEADGLSVFVGDFFDLGREALGTVDAIYDRAALVALPEPLRERYAGHLVHLTHAAPQLLISFDYDPSLLVGPPFSVPEHEVRRHYGAAYHIRGLGRHEVKGGIRGVGPIYEDVWLMERR